VVRPARELDDSIARILTLYGGGNRQFFTLAQWRSHLILRASSRGNDLHRDYRETEAENVLLKNIPRFVTVTSRNGNTTIYADGHRTGVTGNFPILPADPFVSGKFVLGNSPGGRSPWRGDLLFLAAYDRELSAGEVLNHFRDWTVYGTPAWLPGETPSLLYRFDERTGMTIRNHGGSRYDISMPATFHALEKNVLFPPWQEERIDRSFIQDVVVNVLGFLPFGFSFIAWLRNHDSLKRKPLVFLVAAFGLCISLAIELLQTYLPTRTSSLTDVFSNLSGTILGAYLFRWFPLTLHVENKTHR
jgi:VanZ family protein